MGCSGLLSLFRKKRTENGDQDEAFGPRPPHDSIISGNSAFTDIEKPYIRPNQTAQMPRPPPPAANIRPNVNPQFTAYSGIAERDDLYSPQHRGGEGSSYRPGDSRDWTGSQVSTQISSRQSDQQLSKIKDEGGVDDPEHIARQKKAAEIRRKFEEEEQERLDFFQMM